MNGDRKTTDWLTPQNLIALAGMTLAIIGSIQAFKQDTNDRLVKAEYRMDALEKNTSHNSAQLDDHEKKDIDINLRLDRLERKR